VTGKLEIAVVFQFFRRIVAPTPRGVVPETSRFTSLIRPSELLGEKLPGGAHGGAQIASQGR